MQLIKRTVPNQCRSIVFSEQQLTLINQHDVSFCLFIHAAGELLLILPRQLIQSHKRQSSLLSSRHVKSQTTRENWATRPSERFLGGTWFEKWTQTSSHACLQWEAVADLRRPRQIGAMKQAKVLLSTQKTVLFCKNKKEKNTRVDAIFLHKWSDSVF